MPPQPTPAWYVAATLIVAIAAIAQATAAWLIWKLTEQLKDATQSYATETKRMVDHMETEAKRQRALVEREAARRLRERLLVIARDVEFRTPNMSTTAIREQHSEWDRIFTSSRDSPFGARGTLAGGSSPPSSTTRSP